MSDVLRDRVITTIIFEQLCVLDRPPKERHLRKALETAFQAGHKLGEVRANHKKKQ